MPPCASSSGRRGKRGDGGKVGWGRRWAFVSSVPVRSLLSHCLRARVCLSAHRHGDRRCSLSPNTPAAKRRPYPSLARGPRLARAPARRRRPAAGPRPTIPAPSSWQRQRPPARPPPNCPPPVPPPVPPTRRRQDLGPLRAGGRDGNVDRIHHGVDVPQFPGAGRLQRVGRWRRPGQARVAVPTGRPVDTKAEAIHVALLDIVQGVLVRAVGLPARAVPQHRLARRHAFGVELVQKAAGVPFHAQSLDPVRAHRLQRGGVGGVVAVGGGGAMRATWSARRMGGTQPKLPPAGSKPSRPPSSPPRPRLAVVLLEVGQRLAELGARSDVWHGAAGAGLRAGGKDWDRDVAGRSWRGARRRMHRPCCRPATAHAAAAPAHARTEAPWYDAAAWARDPSKSNARSSSSAMAAACFVAGGGAGGARAGGQCAGVAAARAEPRSTTG